MRVSALSLLFASLVAPFALAAPTERDIVETPFGPRPAASFVRVPENGQIIHVGEETHVLDARGNVVHVAKREQEQVPSARRSVATRDDSAYGADAIWTNTGTSPITSFTANWVVPATPATSQGQIIFLFNSLESTYSDVIVPPTLQWGESASGGGNYWSVSGWYLTTSSTYATTPVQVSPGQALDGVITQATTSTGYSYAASFSNIAGTSLSVTNTAALVKAEVFFEGSGAAVTSDFPTGTTDFTNLNIRTAAGTPSVTWVAEGGEGITCTVVTAGATNGVVEFKY